MGLTPSTQSGRLIWINCAPALSHPVNASSYSPTALSWGTVSWAMTPLLSKQVGSVGQGGAFLLHGNEDRCGCSARPIQMR